MDHGIQLLLRDCARYMNEQDDGPGPINGLPPTEEARCIAYVCADLHACGRLIATCASIVNAAAHDVPNVSLRSIIGFFPPVLNWSEISNVSDSRLNFDLELLFNLNSFARRLAFTRTLTNQYLESGGKPVATETSNMLILCDAWRSISLMCDDLLTACQTSFPGSASVLPANGSVRISRLLQDTGAGRWPCVLDDGSIEVLDWAERRRSRRFESNTPLIIHAEKGSYEATARDVSRSGLQVDTCSNMSCGDRVELELLDMRRLTAKVIWVKGTRAGLRFSYTLSDADPLLAS